MKRFLDPKFIEGFLIFFVIQPLLLLIGIGVFIYAIIEKLMS
jgi:hypothetical protein